MAKGVYVGVSTEVPIYETQTTTNTYRLNANNVDKFFTISGNGTSSTNWTVSYSENTYYGYGNIACVPNNIGVNSSTAIMTLTAKRDLSCDNIMALYYKYTTESNYDKVTLTIGNNTKLDAVSGSNGGTGVGGTALISNAIIPAGTEIKMTYAKDTSQHASNEEVLIQFGINDLTITEETQVITGYETKGIARKGKKMYLGINNIARKVKKAYVGVGGVARLFFSGGELAYYGTAKSLVFARTNMSATRVGEYVLFGGGATQNTCYANVDGYSRTLTKKLPSNLYSAAQSMGAASVGNYALFAGGKGLTSDTCFDVVSSYNSSLTGTNATNLSVARGGIGATSIGDYALFAGGSNGGNTSYSLKTVDAYNSSLTRTTPSALSQPGTLLAATSIGDYALFAGMYVSASGAAYSEVVNCYNASLTQTKLTLSAARYAMGAASVGNYALFAGGLSSDVVDAFDSSLTLTVITPLSNTISVVTGWTFDNSSADYAIFFRNKECIDYYDSWLVKNIGTSLDPERYATLGSIGNYVLFAGGYDFTSDDGYTYYNTVDVYTVM